MLQGPARDSDREVTAEEAASRVEHRGEKDSATHSIPELNGEYVAAQPHVNETRNAAKGANALRRLIKTDSREILRRKRYTKNKVKE